MTRHTITDLQQRFSKQKINKAKKLQIREFEETGNNLFICFVDDGKDSYDTRIVLDEKYGIADYGCDCGETGFCLHALALGLFISDNRTAATVSGKKAKKKTSETETAMENIHPEELKAWMLEFFKKNKDAEMHFMLSFGERKKEFSDPEISGLIRKAVVSVAGKRKSLAADDVRKAVDLLAKTLEPVEAFLLQHPDKKESIRKFLLLDNDISAFKLQISFSGTRLDVFQQKHRERFVAHLNTVKDSGMWEELATENWRGFLEDIHSATPVFYKFIKEMYRSGSPEQKRYMAGLVRDQIKIWMETGFRLQISLKEDLLEIIAGNGFFTELQNFFPLEKYESSYNTKLIGEILKTDPRKAEETCRNLLDSGSDEKYGLPYYGILEKIYEAKGSRGDLAYIRRKKFWEMPSFENYLFIAENDTDTEEFRRFRTRILAFLKSNFFGSPENAELYFAILDHGSENEKMLDGIDGNTPTAVINTYAEKLFAVDKNKFLMAVRSRNDWNGTEKDEETLAGFLASRYDVAQLEDSFERKYYGFGSDRFSKAVLNKIQRS